MCNRLELAYGEKPLDFQKWKSVILHSFLNGDCAVVTDTVEKAGVTTQSDRSDTFPSTRNKKQGFSPPHGKTGAEYFSSYMHNQYDWSEFMLQTDNLTNMTYSESSSLVSRIIHSFFFINIDYNCPAFLSLSLTQIYSSVWLMRSTKVKPGTSEARLGKCVYKQVLLQSFQRKRHFLLPHIAQSERQRLCLPIVSYS